MFTGLIEEKGSITAVEDLGDSVRLTIRGPVVTSDAGHGDSIAVNGCCLTVMSQDGDTFGANVMKESLDKTSLGDLGIGDEVNLERATRAGARLGGHIVQGHVDGTG
ncbi:MAG: riboflavin synthase, partial [Aeromicrobium sp.]